METDIETAVFRTGCRILLLFSVLILSACGTGPVVGILYTNVRMPLTLNLSETPMVDQEPSSSRVFEIREPFSGAGIYAKVNTNALGELAREKGLETIHFADQHVVSILGIWKTNRVYLYGNTDTPPGTPVSETEKAHRLVHVNDRINEKENLP